MTTINYGKTNINSTSDGVKRLLGVTSRITVYDDFKARYGDGRKDSYLGWNRKKFIEQLKYFKNSVDILCDLFDVRFYRIEMVDESYCNLIMNEYEKRNKYINIYLYLDKVEVEDIKDEIEKYSTTTKIIDSIRHDRDLFKLAHDDHSNILSISLSDNQLVFSYLFADSDFKDDKNQIYNRQYKHTGIIDELTTDEENYTFKTDKDFIMYVINNVLNWYDDGNYDISYDREREFYEDYISESSWDDIEDEFDDDDDE